ncbi:MAG: hypothetical protein J6S72_07925, partial [Lachnospiraceae bacterium]|nr:hypothetical protein [Lachnospiraceae bacterium]
MIFLGVLLVGWTAFLDYADKAVYSDAAESPSGDKDSPPASMAPDAITQVADGSDKTLTDTPATDEPAVPTSAPTTDIPAPTDV